MVRIVLIHPQIPPNTGNIARTCAATATELHLVGPLGFELSDRYLKRAGLDYWPEVKLRYHGDLESFLDDWRRQSGDLIGFSARGDKNYLSYHFQTTDWLLFGSETEGLSQEILDQCTQRLRIPMSGGAVRSLNLSVSVAVALFEAYRQLDYFES
ncbi:MAG: tRNA (uridine(34)/cytosine(34)/5-carboxymethylaminomethyluridine(34)-2'-O)-methyltransferase TrmL [Cyanobacteriota bacterium]|jgi:tRNA (cytidine/uridine-2'-O-)-methyltransferase